MPMRLTRTASSLGVGVVSGLLHPGGPLKLTPMVIGQEHVGLDSVADVVLLLGGGALQMTMPLTAPNIVDGVVDGAAALLGEKITLWASSKMQATSAANAIPAATRVGALGSMQNGVRPAVGGTTQRSRVTLT